MTIMDKRVLIVVPARGGSKGITRKNLQKIGGVSLVALAAKVAHKINWVDTAIISTDCEEIAAEARSHGLDHLFMRPDELSNDLASSVDVWKHAWLMAETAASCRYEISVLLEPTCPLRRCDDIDRAVKEMLSNKAESCLTVSKTPAHYTPEKTLQVNDSGFIQHYLPSGRQQTIRQLIPPYYHRNGACYIVNRDQLFLRNTIIDENSFAVVIDRPLVNIDDLFDLQIARWLHEANL